MKQFILLLFVAFLSCNGQSDIEWTKGGNLHTATVKEWKAATEANKLATCADFCVRIKAATGQHYLSLIFLKKDSEELMRCIDIASTNESQKVAEIAAACQIIKQ